MRMNELTDSEREFLDEVNNYNKKFCKDHQQSLANVCYGYLNKKFNSDLLCLPEDEIEKILKECNEEGKPVTKLSNDIAILPTKRKSRAINNSLF